MHYIMRKGREDGTWHSLEGMGGGDFDSLSRRQGAGDPSSLEDQGRLAHPYIPYMISIHIHIWYIIQSI